MFDTPAVDGQVPPSPELLHGGGVPPTLVESPLLTSSQLGHKFQEGNKDDVETCEPGHHIEDGNSQISK